MAQEDKINKIYEQLGDVSKDMRTIMVDIATIAQTVQHTKEDLTSHKLRHENLQAYVRAQEEAFVNKIEQRTDELKKKIDYNARVVKYIIYLCSGVGATLGFALKHFLEVLFKGAT
jgi:tRNA A-37 threonylcarbamoyl transferase component Bud32